MSQAKQVIAGIVEDDRLMRVMEMQYCLSIAKQVDAIDPGQRLVKESRIIALKQALQAVADDIDEEACL